MRLHEDKYSFMALLNSVQAGTGIRQDILEKDYYVCLLLKELSEKQEKVPAYFKGGTALYKAQKSIRRFSEDIDLTVAVDGCTNSQAKKRLEIVSKKYTSLPRTVRKELEEDRKGSITSVYDYIPNAIFDENDPLQRFGFVKVEATSFTVSEPFTELEIEPVVYTFADKEQQKILRENFEVQPFMIKTIRLERIFADKIFAAEFYYEREMLFDVAKHLYDTSVMFSLPEIQKLVEDKEMFQRMLGYKRLEEERRTGSDLSDKQFKDFTIFEGVKGNANLEKAFMEMQEIYVFNEIDKLDFEFVIKQWDKIEKVLPVNFAG